MKKSKITFFVLGFVLVILVLIKLGKPTVRIDSGLFFPSDVYGIHVAASKNMPVVDYTFKISIYNVRDFSPTTYKKKYPQDIVLGSGWSAKILTDNAANLINELSSLGIEWVRIEHRDLNGKISDSYEKKYLGFL